MNTFAKLILSTGIVCAIGIHPAHADTYDLAQLYQSALDYDADIAAAQSAHTAEQAQENTPPPALPPQLAASASKPLPARRPCTRSARH